MRLPCYRRVDHYAVVVRNLQEKYKIVAIFSLALLSSHCFGYYSITLSWSLYIPCACPRLRTVTFIVNTSSIEQNQEPWWPS